MGIYLVLFPIGYNDSQILICCFYQEEVKKNYMEETFPNTLANLEKILISNNGGDGFFVGKKVRLNPFHFRSFGTNLINPFKNWHYLIFHFLQAMGKVS